MHPADSMVVIEGQSIDKLIRHRVVDRSNCVVSALDVLIIYAILIDLTFAKHQNVPVSG